MARAQELHMCGVGSTAGLRCQACRVVAAALQQSYRLQLVAAHVPCGKTCAPSRDYQGIARASSSLRQANWDACKHIHVALCWALGQQGARIFWFVLLDGKRTHPLTGADAKEKLGTLLGSSMNRHWDRHYCIGTEPRASKRGACMHRARPAEK